MAQNAKVTVHPAYKVGENAGREFCFSVAVEGFNWAKQVMLSFDEYGAMQRPLQELHPGYGRYNMARNHYRFDPERKYILHDLQFST